MYTKLSLIAALSLGLIAGCSAESAASDSSDETSTETKAVFDGVYQVEGKSYTWAAFHDGRYAFWKAGTSCNDDYSKAPASCLESGTFRTSEDTISFTDAKTGETEKEIFDAGTSDLGTRDVPLVTSPSQDLNGGGASSGGKSLTNQQGQALVQEANLRKGLMTIFTACQLLSVDPRLTGPEALPEVKPPVQIVASTKCSKG